MPDLSELQIENAALRSVIARAIRDAQDARLPNETVADLRHALGSLPDWRLPEFCPMCGGKIER